MAVVKYKILLCTIICLSGVTCKLNLPEGSPCITNEFKGVCANVFKCNSAALSYMYAVAGFDIRKHNRLPDLPDICSYQNNEPVVCCTDCEIGEEKYRNFTIGLSGELVKKEDGAIAKHKFYEYFNRLPYICHDSTLILTDVKKNWVEPRKCHVYEVSYLGINLVRPSGGRNAERWEFPHMALIGYGNEVESAQWLCGGSVISERFILTAAHCTSTTMLGSISFAALGLLKRTDPKKYWKIYKIKSIIIYPEYKAPSKYHDIALLETVNEIAFGRDLLPASLDAGLEWKYYAQASGWGRLGHRKALTDTLQVVKLEMFNETDCAAMYKPHRHLSQGYDHEKQMCYGSNNEVVDTCEGDSGGPLQVNTNDDKCFYTIVGVTSYGKDCGILGSAGMYTRVSYYLPWIESIVWPEETEARRKKDNEWLDKWLN